MTQRSFSLQTPPIAAQSYDQVLTDLVANTPAPNARRVISRARAAIHRPPKPQNPPKLAWCYESIRDNSSSPGNSSSGEIRQVVFAKVHKAASSTLQNILLRFTIARNLSSLLPTKGPIISQGNSIIQRAKVIPHIQGLRFYDTLASHVVYDDSQISRYFSKDAFRVAIIREPMKQVLSALVFYTVVYPQPDLKAGYLKHKDDPINGFLKHPEDFTNGKKCPPPYSYVNTKMSFDLGLNINNIESTKMNRTKIQIFLDKLEKELGLVLISDYFDESMVLLKRTLRWSIKDILYIKVNEMRLDKNSSWRKKPNLTSTEYLAFRYCNKIDYALYDHFLPMFLDKIEKERLFQEEVSSYKDILQSLRDFCSNTTRGDKLRVPKSEWTAEFFVYRCECDLMLQKEDSMVDIVRQRQLWLRSQYESNPLRPQTTKPPLSSPKPPGPPTPKPPVSAVTPLPLSHLVTAKPSPG
ncbi:galactose-3-O-sulfotransferase 3 [Elysia marginata]|uniref:Galactose-3-O-sulfotransferase 3 n=1 Tax=Elysia marginata TaxID=1093978 RepID=A0AAV4GX49_9GAST|nr:galactose-3-O-sulfotransferase 3 [Elysia marginata]